MSDDFIRDLEEGLVAAARSRAARRSRRFVLPRMPRHALRSALIGAAALTLLAVLAALALNRGGDDRAADERRATPPPAGLVVPLPAMLPGAACRKLSVRSEPAAGRFPEIGIFARSQRANDAVDPPQGNEITWLPVRTFDTRETRLAGYRRLQAGIDVIPSLGVSLDGRCGSDDGEGLCLVDPSSRFRCFTKSQVDGGGALALTSEGVIVGVVPDGIDSITLTARGESVTADVVENVYEARLPVAAGTQIHVAPRPADPGCRRAVAPQLLDRVAVLRRPAEDGQLLPRAALDVLDEWRWQLDAIVEDGARFWGGGGGVEFWAVPVVPRVSKGCALATGVCIVAVPEDVRADAHCVWGERELREGTWKLAPLWPDHAVLYGIVADGVSGARVSIGSRTATIDASDNVVGGKLPFPYRDEAKTDVALIRRPQPRPPIVGVVDATGGDRPAAEHAQRAVRDAGLGYLDGIVPGVKPQPRTDVYWRSGRTTRQQAESVAELLVADQVQRIDPERTPRPVLETDAAIVVVVGSER